MVSGMMVAIAHLAYDSDSFRKRIWARGIQLVCLHRKNFPTETNYRSTAPDRIG